MIVAISAMALDELIDIDTLNGMRLWMQPLEPEESHTEEPEVQQVW